MNYEVDYTDEQKLIRRECFRRRKETIDLVNGKKWDLIQKQICVEDCTICNNPVMGKIETHVMSCVFRLPKEFNLDCQKTIERIYGENGEMTQQKWFRGIMQDPPSSNTLLYLLKNNLISPDYSDHVTLLSLYAIYRCTIYWKDTFDLILSDDIGFNINLQDIYGDNIILSILRKDYYDEEDFYPDEREDKYIQIYNDKITYLLEKGADPLLENKEGLSAIEYARNLKSFPQTQKDDLIRILERYI
jgi:hypothetical protein